MKYKIKLGECGPTDCCLTLVRLSDGKEKQYGIETEAWELLGEYWNIATQTSEIISDELGDDIWNNYDCDVC